MSDARALVLSVSLNKRQQILSSLQELQSRVCRVISTANLAVAQSQADTCFQATVVVDEALGIEEGRLGRTEGHTAFMRPQARQDLASSSGNLAFAVDNRPFDMQLTSLVQRYRGSGLPCVGHVAAGR